MSTIRVFWKGKFEGKAVTIDATAFDPAIHRHEADGHWPAKAEPVVEAKADATEPAETATEEAKPKRKAK